MAGSCGSFRQLEDKPCSSEIFQMKWSPKMDLLALVTREGDVWLNRLSWKRVWSISASEGRAVCLAWRPDGKLLAVGYESGNMKLFDIENAECIHTCSINHKVVFMDWMEEEKVKSTGENEDQVAFYEERAGVYLPVLPQLPKTGGALFSKESTQTHSTDPKRLRSLGEELSVLVVGDEIGQVHLFVYGMFHSGTVNTRSASSASGGVSQVISASLSKDLQSLSVVVKIGTNDSEANHTVSLLLYDTTLLASRSHELAVVAKKHGEIATLTEYFDEAIRAMSDAWEDILLEMDTKLTQFATKRACAGSSVSSEFLTLLTRGVASPELQSFLIHKLTEKGLKKLGHSVENSYSSIQSLALKHVECVTQALLYHVTEMNGMAKWYGRFGVLGLEDTSVQLAIRSIGSLMLKTRELVQVIGTSLRSFKAFFQWLYCLILRLSDEPVPSCIKQFSQQDIILVAAFLEDQLAFDKQGKFTLERVGQYFEDKPLAVKFSSSASSWSAYVESIPELKASPLLIPQESTESLAGLCRKLKENMNEVFSNPAKVIGQSLLFKCAIPLWRCSDSSVGIPVVTQTWSVLQSSQLVAFTASGAVSEKLYVISLTIDQAEQVPVIMAVSVTISQLGDSIQPGVTTLFKDAKFYDSETLSVLLEEQGEGNADEDALSVIAQIPLSHVKQDFAIKLCRMSSIVELSGLPCHNIASNVTHFRRLIAMRAKSLSVSGTRKVSCVLATSSRRIRLFDMDADDEDEDETEIEAESDHEKEENDKQPTKVDSELSMSL